MYSSIIVYSPQHMLAILYDKTVLEGARWCVIDLCIKIKYLKVKLQLKHASAAKKSGINKNKKH